MNKWKTIVLNWLLIFLAVLFLRNILKLFRAIVYAENLDGDYHIAGSLTYFFLLLLLLSVAIWRLRKPSRAFLLWAIALAAALYIPAYEWPEHAWKIAHNKDRYDALIAQDPQTPKFTVLDYKEFPFYFGLNSTWLVFDESDEIELPSQLRSDEWKRRTRPHIYLDISEQCSLEVSKIEMHYYYLFEQC